jgi:hypothetical protein
MALSQPDIAAILHSVLPRDAAGKLALFARTPDGGVSVLGLHTQSLFIAMGILGATVMPHNLYLHSALVQSREIEPTDEGRREACRLNLVDSADRTQRGAVRERRHPRAGRGGVQPLRFHRGGELEGGAPACWHRCWDRASRRCCSRSRCCARDRRAR